MKRRLLFLGSVFAMLLILAMWFLTLRDRAYDYYIEYISTTGGGTICITECSTLYGLGENIVGKDGAIRHVGSIRSHWWEYYLPPIKFGWVLLVFAIFQWLLLFRKIQWKPKNTKPFAIGVLTTKTGKERVSMKTESKVKPGDFLFDLKYFRLFAYIQIAFAAVIFIGNTLCVLISKNLKYILYSNGYAFESLQLNIEYVFPGVLYLFATLISVYCLRKYIKSCKSS